MGHFPLFPCFFGRIGAQAGSLAGSVGVLCIQGAKVVLGLTRACPWPTGGRPMGPINQVFVWDFRGHEGEGYICASPPPSRAINFLVPLLCLERALANRNCHSLS